MTEHHDPHHDPHHDRGDASLYRSGPVAPVICVLGGCGGIGATRFAAVLATVSAARYGQAVLLDLDPAGGGIDIALGIESVPGVRWSGLRVAGGRLDPAALLQGVPRWGSTHVVAADTAQMPAPGTVSQVLAAAGEVAPVVADLSRWGDATRTVALARADLVVLVVAGDVPGVAAARSVVSALGRGAQAAPDHLDPDHLDPDHLDPDHLDPDQGTGAELCTGLELGPAFEAGTGFELGPAFDPNAVGAVVRTRSGRHAAAVAELIGARLLGRLAPIRARTESIREAGALLRLDRQVAAEVLGRAMS